MSKNLSLRSFLAGSAAVGGMMAGFAGSASAASKLPEKWNFEADVVVVGAGAAGIPVAIRAVEAGLKTLIVDANYDIGGHAIISQGNTLLGGGTAAQKKYGIEDSPEAFFQDLVDWSVTLPNGFPDYRFNDRDQAHMIAYNSVPTYDWLVRIGVPFLDKKPDNAGAYGAGCSAPRELHFSWTKGASLEAPAGTAGTVLMRSLEDAARKAGVQFLLNYYMDEILRKEGEKGRCCGIRAHFSPKVLPDGTRLKSFRSDGNVECEEKEITVHAKKVLVPVQNGKKVACEGSTCEGDFDWSWTQHTGWRIDSKSNKDVFYLSVFDNGDSRGMEQPALPEMKYSRAVVYKIDQKAGTVEQIWEYGKERGHEWYSPVTSLTEYQADKDSVFVYSATAGAQFNLKTGGFESAPNPFIEEFNWGEKEPALEIQLINTQGFQAMPVDLKKAFGN